MFTKLQKQKKVYLYPDITNKKGKHDVAIDISQIFFFLKDYKPTKLNFIYKIM